MRLIVNYHLVLFSIASISSSVYRNVYLNLISVDIPALIGAYFVRKFAIFVCLLRFVDKCLKSIPYNSELHN